MKKKGIIIGIIAVIVIVVAIVAMLFLKNKIGLEDKKTEPKKEVEKNITVEIVPENNKSQKYTLTTKKEYLQEALDEIEGLEYVCREETNEILTVNGITYDVTKNYVYWSTTINGKSITHTIDKEEIHDGDEVVISFTCN